MTADRPCISSWIKNITAHEASLMGVPDMEHALEERLETGHIIGPSLILDVLDLHGGDA